MTFNINSNSVSICNINCPKCNRVAKLLDYFWENKEDLECPACGYESFTDRETNETNEKIGYGVIHIEFLNQPMIHVLLNHPITDLDRQGYLKRFEDFYVIKEKSYFYEYNPSENIFTISKGSNPIDFDDYVQEQIDHMEYERSLSFGNLSGNIEPFNFLP